MVIDFHTHNVPKKFPDMANRAGEDRWPTMEVNNGSYNVMISGKVFRPVGEDNWSAEKRLEDMVAEGVTQQVISPMPELMSYWFEPQDTLEFCQYINQDIANIIQKAPDRFYGLGILPLQDPELAAKNVPRLKSEFGLHGIEVGSNINGHVIGDPMFKPFFEAAEKEGIVIMVHALHPTGNERLIGPPQLPAAISFPSETAYAVSSIITGGILEEFPKLKFMISHGGGGFPMVLPRLTQAWHTVPSIKEILPKPPEEYARKMFYDALVYDERSLKYLIEMFGASQIVLGTDYPFIIRQKNPGQAVENIGLSQELINAITHENSLLLLGETI